jgi:hypothetical protein
MITRLAIDEFSPHLDIIIKIMLSFKPIMITKMEKAGFFRLSIFTE